MLNCPSHPFTAPQFSVLSQKFVSSRYPWKYVLVFRKDGICRWYVLDDGIRIYLYAHMHTRPPPPSDAFCLAPMLNCTSDSSLVCFAFLLISYFFLLFPVVNVTESFECTKEVLYS